MSCAGRRFPTDVSRRASPDPKPRLIDAQNGVALPSDVLDALGVESGDHVAFELESGRVTLHKVRWTVEKA